MNEQIADRYRDVLAGFYARMYQGRCQQKLGNHRAGADALRRDPVPNGKRRGFPQPEDQDHAAGPAMLGREQAAAECRGGGHGRALGGRGPRQPNRGPRMAGPAARLGQGPVAAGRGTAGRPTRRTRSRGVCRPTPGNMRRWWPGTAAAPGRGPQGGGGVGRQSGRRPRTAGRDAAPSTTRGRPARPRCTRCRRRRTVQKTVPERHADGNAGRNGPRADLKRQLDEAQEKAVAAAAEARRLFRLARPWPDPARMSTN